MSLDTRSNSVPSPAKPAGSGFAIKQVKELGREIIGQPKPTQVRGRRKHRRPSKIAGALDIYAPEPIPDDIVVPRFAQNPMAHGGTAHVPVTPKRLREKHDVAPVVHYTPEVVAHANFLMKTEGKCAMELYLKQLKEQTVMSTSSVHLAESLHKNREEAKIHETAGGIGKLLQDAEEKAKHFREESEKLVAEADRWDKVAESLREAVQLTSGEVTAKKSRNTSGIERAPHGFWREKMKEIFADGKPRTRQEILAAMTAIKLLSNPSSTWAKVKNDGIVVPHGDNHYTLSATA